MEAEAPPYTIEDFEQLRALLARVAGEAAAYLRDNFGLDELLAVVSKHEHDEDEGLRVDLESESNILELLRAEGFRGLFLGEEKGLIKLGSEPLIIVADPLDGSKNYAGLIPWSAVSLAAAPVAGREPSLLDVVAGAIAPVFPWPVLSFTRGRGAFEGGSRVKPHQHPSRILLTYAEKTTHARIIEAYLRLTGDKRSVRALGSASLEIAWAGLGRVEAFIDVRGRLRIVDVAAAVWLAAEAGSIVYVEKPNASLTRVERVGGVVVTASRDAWERIRKAMAVTSAGDSLKPLAGIKEEA